MRKMRINSIKEKAMNGVSLCLFVNLKLYKSM